MNGSYRTFKLKEIAAHPQALFCRKDVLWMETSGCPLLKRPTNMAPPQARPFSIPREQPPLCNVGIQRWQ
jgi:hypothetical protein